MDPIDNQYRLMDITNPWLRPVVRYHNPYALSTLPIYVSPFGGVHVLSNPLPPMLQQGTPIPLEAVQSQLLLSNATARLTKIGTDANNGDNTADLCQGATLTTKNRQKKTLTDSIKKMYDDNRETDTTKVTTPSSTNNNDALATRVSLSSAASSSSSSSSVAASTTGSSPTMPSGPWDVPFGRGRSTRTHPGFKNFHRLLDKYQTEYEQASKFGKTDIANRIIKIIQSNGGSFFKPNSDGTITNVSHLVARDKVSHAFRTKRRIKPDHH